MENGGESLRKFLSVWKNWVYDLGAQILCAQSSEVSIEPNCSSSSGRQAEINQMGTIKETGSWMGMATVKDQQGLNEPFLTHSRHAIHR